MVNEIVITFGIFTPLPRASLAAPKGTANAANWTPEFRPRRPRARHFREGGKVANLGPDAATWANLG
jgi:hypothetical protein